MDRGNEVAKPMNVPAMESFPPRKDASGNRGVRAQAGLLIAGYERKSRNAFASPAGKGPPVDQLDLYNFPVPS
jgi:hypothetical protein